MGVKKAANMAADGASKKEIKEANPGLSNKQVNTSLKSAPSPAASAPSPAASAAASAAPPRPASVQDSYVDAGSGTRYNTRFIPNTGEDGKGVWAAGPMSDDEIRGLYSGWASSWANGAGTSAGQATGKPAAQASNRGNRQKAIKESSTLSEALKIAASNDAAIGTKEFKNIQKTFGVDASKVVGNLDALNEKFGSKRGYIGIKGNTANRYARGGFGPTTGLSIGLVGGDNNKGPLANALAGMNDTYSPMRQGQGGYKTEGFGKAPKGSSIWGFANDSPLYRETTKGTSGWGQFAPSLLPRTVDTTTDTTSNSSITGTETTGTNETATGLIPDKKPMSPEEMAAASTGNMGDPFAFGGAFSWRSAGKGKKSKGIKSTKTAGAVQAAAPLAYNLKM